jgi:diadenosine tetraphosphate (Ap4A) HIT family hydrolase
MAKSFWSVSDYDAAIAPYVNRSVKSCSYCARLIPLTLIEGHHVMVNLTIGHMTAGYLQVCPRTHIASAAELQGIAAAEFDAAADAIRTSFANVYGTAGIVFEHGRIRDDEQAEGGHHAHVHFVPRAVDLLPAILAVGVSSVQVKNWQEVRTMRMTMSRNAAYLYYASGDGGHVFPLTDSGLVPPHFLRTCLAAALGQPGIADWRGYPGTALFNRTRAQILETLCDKLRQRGGRITSRTGEPLQWTT